MSTILDALKKVERDREAPPHEEPSNEMAAAAPPRRGIPTRVIIACASIGFAAGIALALWRDTAPLQQPPAPEPITAPVIDVPAPPAVAQAVPRDQRAAAGAAAPHAGAEQAAAAPAAAAAPGPPPAGAAAPVEVASADTPPAVPPAVANPPAPIHPAAVANPPDVPSAPPANPAVPSNATGAVAPPPPATGAPATAGTADHLDSTLEPSPFVGDHPLPAPPPVAGANGHGSRGARRAASGAGGPNEPAKKPAAPAPVVALAPPPPLAPALAPPPPAPEPPPAPAEGETGQPPTMVIDTGRSPPGTPRVSLTFLQWSADPERRFAFVSIDGAPAQRVREGDTTSGMTVAQITPTGVQFRRESQLFMIRPRH